MTYDNQADAIHIQLKDSVVAYSKHVSPNCALDLDDTGEVIGVEILNARKSGIDSLSLVVQHTQTERGAARPDQEAIPKERAARLEAVKLYKAAGRALKVYDSPTS